MICPLQYKEEVNMEIGVAIFSGLVILGAFVWNLYDKHTNKPQTDSKAEKKPDIK